MSYDASASMNRIGVPLVMTWSWDRQIIERREVEFDSDNVARALLPRAIHEAAEQGRLTPASRIEVEIHPDRRTRTRRRADR